MKSKERVIRSLNHKVPDKVPVDFGGTGQTGIHISCVQELRNYFGLDKTPVKAVEPYQMLGLIEDDLKECIGIDTLSVDIGYTMFGFRNENWKEWKAPWGQVILVAENFNTVTDENGDYLIFPLGDKTAPPSGKMPKSSYFFDAVIRQEEIVDEKLNPEDNTEEFAIISDIDISLWKKEIAKIRNNDKALIANTGGTALGDIALVPAVNLKSPRGIRSIEEWYMSILTRQDYIHRIFDIQSDIAVKNLCRLLPVMGNTIDIIFICGTDFGTQTSTFCSIKTFRELWMPYYKRINDWIHKNTNWKTFKHCCGSIKSLIPSFLDSGFDILNPVQISAANMDVKELKSEFGDHMVFWGGGVDTQKTLPFGTPDNVRREVLERCEILSQGGGFVFSSIHNIQANTPVENIVAMFDAIKEFNS